VSPTELLTAHREAEADGERMSPSRLLTETVKATADIANATYAVAYEEGQRVANAQRDRYREALRDIVLGAQMMLEIPGESACARYASEVKRVAEAALRGDA
jgi:regulator of protease activity HflC (stomatin/prohibitin superfamily)